MKGKVLNSPPPGYHTEHYLKALNYADLQNASIRGDAHVGTGGVMFRFHNFRDAVDITIDLRKTPGGDDLADELNFDAIPNSADKYVVFEGFPADFRLSKCEYEVWVLAQGSHPSDKSTVVEFEIAYRAK